VAVEKIRKIKKLSLKVALHAEQFYHGADKDLFVRFIELYFNQASFFDLRSRAVADIYGVVHTHWEFFYKRGPEELKISLFNPTVDEYAWHSEHSCMQFVFEDMPFLVDSIRMEIDRMGLSTHLIIHTGGIWVKRNKFGVVEDIAPHSSKNEGFVLEAPIYFEIDQQSNKSLIEELERNLVRVISDVKIVVDDWQPMILSMQQRIAKILQQDNFLNRHQVNESLDYMEWLLNDNFTFLGKRDYVVVGEAKKLALQLVPGSGLGVLRDESGSKKMRYFSALPSQAREEILSKKSMLVISQTNTESTVHRRGLTIYFGIKEFDAKGKLIGERRFIGLYTSKAYGTNPSQIPFLRGKVVNILKKSGFPQRSHARKDLMHILTTLPRDDFFQATSDELLNLSLGILHMQDRRQVRLFVRKDAFARFMSCLVYFPRDLFNTDLISKMQHILMRSFAGTKASFTTHLTDSVLAHVHYIIRVDPNNPLEYELKTTENLIKLAAESWRDGLKLALLAKLGENQANELYVKYTQSFPPGYKDVTAPAVAAQDILHMEILGDDTPLAMNIFTSPYESFNEIRFKLFHYDDPVILSHALPILENMGLKVISEQSFALSLADGRDIWVSDFSMQYESKSDLNIGNYSDIFKQAFYQVWSGLAVNDSLNKLVLKASLSWREVMLLRACSKYLQQAEFKFSQQYITESLVSNSNLSKLLVDLFSARFTPTNAEVDRKKQFSVISRKINKALKEIRSLDEDTIIRYFVALISSLLRTNYFQLDDEGCFKPYLSLKLCAKDLPNMPRPVPMYEIYVYSPRFEGLHLRMDAVARGGLRWSDRKEDYRTEVLGLMKAQQVKNAIIVPAGAKGGFILKTLPDDASRDVAFEEAIFCYKQFIAGLLDCVDNRVDGNVICHANTICYDEDDSYLVVAADKGTATFSDIANSVSASRQYWLDDAFASGGSTGYDHKKIGITAKGAWVSAQHLFKELGQNLDQDTVSVIGIGDMSGDVFGNGMLISNKIKLVAAFNHKHIFIDPSPTEKSSFAERIRLFNLPRSSWSDYTPSLISPGGGVFDRSAKLIHLTPEIKALLDVSVDEMIPNDLIKAILSAPVDMLWNGGIGTFVRSMDELDMDVGDRNNDAIRITANKLRVRVVCEGGNLGLTQKSRIDFSLKGGKINTDFIDNSAGVDCSDHEVNIKILLNSIMAEKNLSLKKRNKLLLSMSEDVERLVLANNYDQNFLISKEQYCANINLELWSYFIDDCVDKGLLDRELEFLPSQSELHERKSFNVSLTRPEVAVLVSYSKIILSRQLSSSGLLSQSYYQAQAKKEFPQVLNRRYPHAIDSHSLNKEIIITHLSNQIVSDMGVTFVYQMQHETGRDVADIVYAYSVALELFDFAKSMNDVYACGFLVDANIQYEMSYDLCCIVRRATRWLLCAHVDFSDLFGVINLYKRKVALLFKRLPSYLCGVAKDVYIERFSYYQQQGVGDVLAKKVAISNSIYHALNIVTLELDLQQDISTVAKTYFRLADNFDLMKFRGMINSYIPENEWIMLSKSLVKIDLDWSQRVLTKSVLKTQVSQKSINNKVLTWSNKRGELFMRFSLIMKDLRSSAQIDFAVISVGIRELLSITKSLED
jgi:glutamate dehydrogenase